MPTTWITPSDRLPHASMRRCKRVATCLLRAMRANTCVRAADKVDTCEQYEAIAQKREEEKAKAIKGRPKGRVSKPGQMD